MSESSTVFSIWTQFDSTGFEKPGKINTQIHEPALGDTRFKLALRAEKKTCLRTDQRSATTSSWR